MKIVIIGNSAAAVGAVEGLRQVDSESQVTIISKEEESTYSRPLISYWLEGACTEEGMCYRNKDFYEKNNVTPILGTAATAIDSVGHKVTLEDGREIPYDRLLVATGSRPFVPPMAGLEQVKKKFTFLSKADARSLRDALTPLSRVLILGAGLIGLKCAEGILSLVDSVTVVDLAPQILNSILDVPGAQRVQRHLEKQGVRFMLKDSAACFEGNTAHLKSGAVVEFDILVVAVGVRPNVNLLEEAGAKVDRGVVVDDNGATSLHDVYAAGDCAQSYDVVTGQRRVLALLPNAYMQGESAGIAMAGGEKPYHQGMAMNSIGFFGLHMVTAGAYEGDVYATEDEHTYKKLFVKDDRLVGYIIIGDVSRAGIYTALIREKIPLSSIDFDLIRRAPQLMAFTTAERHKMLGGKR